MNGFVGLCVVLLAVWCLCSSGSGSTAGRATAARSVKVGGRAHLHPGGTKHRAFTHEGGHVAGARGVGGKVHSAEVFADGSGIVWATVPNAKASIVTLLAGQIAHGSKMGAAADDALIRKTLREFPAETLREFPADERAAVMAECKRDARRIVSQRRGEIRRVARTLDERGRL